MKTQKILLLIAVAVLAQFTTLESTLAADCNTNGCWINGSILRSDSGAALSGVVVFNTTNSSQTDTTGADGYFNISGFGNKTNHNLTVTAPSGFTSSTLSINVSGADNTSTVKTLTIITPVNSAITESSGTRDQVTISWTVSDSYVANRITYGLDSALSYNNQHTSWSNSTASPSFTLSNLYSGSVYYYQVESYNLANTSYSDSDTGNYTTGSARKRVISTPTPALTVTKKKAPFASILGDDSISDSSRSVFVKAIIAVVVIGAAWIWLSGRGKDSKPKPKKRK